MLNNAAILVTFTGKMWNARKFDGQTTSEVQAAKKAKQKSGRYNKMLMPDDPKLAEIKAHLAATRHYHYAHTLPWEWKGGQLLPSKHYMKYSKEMASMIRQFDDLVDEFCDPSYYAKAIERAKIHLADLFDPIDYPPPQEIRNQFYATVEYAPVPSAGDYRVELAASEVQRLKEDYQERQAKVVQQATQHMYEKLHDLAEHAKERLSDPKKSFHGTLTENIKEFAELVPELNINKDAFLEQAARELRIAIGDKDIDSLRKDEQVRATAAQDATTILDKVKKQMEAFHAKT
jgi:hypothetical protein